MDSLAVRAHITSLLGSYESKVIVELPLATIHRAIMECYRRIEYLSKQYAMCTSARCLQIRDWNLTRARLQRIYNILTGLEEASPARRHV